MAFAVWFVQILIMLFLAGFKILYTIFKYDIVNISWHIFLKVLTTMPA